MAGEQDKKPSTDAEQRDERAKRSRKNVRAGVAFGIGSAAIVAALLYAGRNRARDKD